MTDTAIEQRPDVPVEDSGKLDMVRFAAAIVASPEMKRWKDVGSTLLAMRAGREMGMTEGAALSNLYVINGKVCVEGSALRGVVRSCAALKKGTDFDCFWLIDGLLYPDGEVETITKLEEIKTERLNDWGSTFGCIVSAQRDGWDKPKAASFTVSDARGADLWNKKDNWKKYPLDMLEWRATSRWGKKYAGDVTVGGLYTVEEMQSIDLGEVTPVRREAPTTPDPLMATIDPPALPEAPATAVESPEDYETEPAAEVGQCPVCSTAHKPSAPCVKEKLF